MLDLSLRPRQGRLGDCWVMASLLALHSTAPHALGRIIGDACASDRADASAPLTVRLGDGTLVPVTRTMPVDAQGRWVYATQSGHGRTSGPGWAGAVEKALAVHLAGSYGWLARGLGRFGLQALTGARCRTHILLPSSSQLEAWTRTGHAVLASTHPLSGLVTTAHGPVPTNHVMAVVGADPVSGHVHLRNPWRPDDVLTVDRRTFRRGFLSVDRTQAPLR